MITLITGQPGSGKTALAVSMLLENNRPLYVMGIPELQIPHVPTPPVAEWTELRTSPEDESIQLPYFTFEQNGLVVIDEAQRVFRPRPVGSKVPQEVQAFETHRHTGIDFILLTQNPGLLDSNIRKLIGRHIHIRVTPFGRFKFEWAEVGDPDSHASRSTAAKSRYTLPKKAFSQYKSAELHTKIKVAVPWYYYAFFGGIAAIGFLGWKAYTSMKAKTEPTTAAHAAPGDGSGKSHGHGAQPPGSASMTVAEYNASLQPRVPGQWHTAPRYDEITKPVDAPWPAACVQRAAWRDRPASCRCIDQQGNNYATDEPTCRQIVANGQFKDWQSPRELAAEQAKAQHFEDRPAKPEQPRQAQPGEPLKLSDSHNYLTQIN